MKKCLNCNHELQPYDKFCAYCGQKVDLSRKHFWAGLSDFFVDAFSFDSKVFVSLRDLLLKPGLITKQYNAGKQARFVPPLRMYLTITILFFLIDSYVDKLAEEKPWEAYKVENEEPYALLKITVVRNNFLGISGQIKRPDRKDQANMVTLEFHQKSQPWTKLIFFLALPFSDS